jgi:superfamily II DNA or RNA helicase
VQDTPPSVLAEQFGISRQMLNLEIRDKFAADAFELIFVNEAHHIRANTYERILSHFTGAMAIVGLTATPCRRDGRGLRDIFDALVEAATLRDRIEQGSSFRYGCSPRKVRVFVPQYLI